MAVSLLDRNGGELLVVAVHDLHVFLQSIQAGRHGIVMANDWVDTESKTIAFAHFTTLRLEGGKADRMASLKALHWNRAIDCSVSCLACALPIVALTVSIAIGGA